MKQPEEGLYAISEVGDLGLGLTPINEEEMTEQGKTDMERERGKSLI